jgi:hypothetical protein
MPKGFGTIKTKNHLKRIKGRILRLKEEKPMEYVSHVANEKQ